MKKQFFLWSCLRTFHFVKTEHIDKKQTKKEEFLSELQEAVKQVNLAKQGKVKLKSAEELLNEL